MRLFLRFAGVAALAAGALASLSIASPALVSPAFAGQIDIHIDKSAQQMTVALDQVPLHVWPVSTGRSGYDTPNGSWKAFRLEEDHYSREWDDAPMPHSVFFTQEGHAIHGTFDEKKLGQPASHGCVRLSRANAAALFALVRKEGLRNTRVTLTGVTPPSAPAVASTPKKKPPREQYVYDDYYGPTGSVGRRREVYIDPRYYRGPPARDGWYYGEPRYRYRDPYRW